jgi:hypothetical protein
MKIIGIMQNPRGYWGFLEENDKYVYFRFSKKRGLKRLVEYAREDFSSYKQFVEVMTRFVPVKMFLKKPIHMTKMDFDSLYCKLNGKRP